MQWITADKTGKEDEKEQEARSKKTVSVLVSLEYLASSMRLSLFI